MGRRLPMVGSPNTTARPRPPFRRSVPSVCVPVCDHSPACGAHSTNKGPSALRTMGSPRTRPAWRPEGPNPGDRLWVHRRRGPRHPCLTSPTSPGPSAGPSDRSPRPERRARLWPQPQIRGPVHISSSGETSRTGCRPPPSAGSSRGVPVGVAIGRGRAKPTGQRVAGTRLAPEDRGQGPPAPDGDVRRALHGGPRPQRHASQGSAAGTVRVGESPGCVVIAGMTAPTLDRARPPVENGMRAGHLIRGSGHISHEGAGDVVAHVAHVGLRPHPGRRCPTRAHAGSRRAIGLRGIVTDAATGAGRHLPAQPFGPTAGRSAPAAPRRL